jgi:hypothetical protein
MPGRELVRTALRGTMTDTWHMIAYANADLLVAIVICTALDLRRFDRTRRNR